MVCINTMVAFASIVIKIHYPRQNQHQSRKHKQPYFCAFGNNFVVGKIGRNHSDNTQHYGQYTAKQVRQNARNNSKTQCTILHVFAFFWYPQPESNQHLILRRNLFYPIELWGQVRIFYSQILILQVILNGKLIHQPYLLIYNLQNISVFAKFDY